jgi:hypothetical protein
VEEGVVLTRKEKRLTRKEKRLMRKEMALTRKEIIDERRGGGDIDLVCASGAYLRNVSMK